MSVANCPEEGRLRAHLDGELVGEERDAVARHLAGCEECARRAEELRATMGSVAGALAVLPRAAGASDGVNGAGEPDARAALARFQARRRGEERARQGRPRLAPVAWLGAPRLRPAVAAASVALVLALVLSVTPLQSLANRLSTIFRVERFAVVTVPVPGMQGVPSPESLTDAEKAQLATMLSALGRLETQATPQNVREVPTLDDALRHYQPHGTLYVLADDELPAGFAGAPVRYAVSDPISAKYTLYTAMARQFAGMAGANEVAGLLPDPNAVPELTFTLDVPAAVAMFYGDETRGFGVVQLASPTLTIPDQLDIVAFRTAVLGVPGLVPPDTADQIRAIDEDDLDKTLIIPVPQDATTRSVEIEDDNDGIVIVDGQGRGVVVIWQVGGTLYALGGTGLTPDEALAAARALR